MIAASFAQNAPGAVHGSFDNTLGAGRLFSPVYEVTTPAAPPFQPDNGLPRLIEDHSAAVVAAIAAEAALNAAQARFDELAPKRPATLLYRFGDPHPGVETCITTPDGRRLMAYAVADIEELRASPDPHSYRSIAGQPFGWWPDARQIERKAEILTDFDGWEQERIAVAETVGLTTASSQHRQASEIAKRIEAEILDAPVRTIADLAAKARWIEAQGQLTKWSSVIVWDAINLQESTSLNDGCQPSTQPARVA